MTITADQDCSASDDIEKPPDDEQDAPVDPGTQMAAAGIRRSVTGIDV